MNEVDVAGTTRPQPRSEADARRFEELYRQWHSPVVRLCRKFLRTEGDPEAVANEAFIRAWSSWESYSPERPFWPWIATIARRLCLNELMTTRRREAQGPQVFERFVPSTFGEEDLDRLLRADLIGHALGGLTRRYRRLLFLREVEDWTYEEIARLDGVSVTAVKGSLRRARVAFRSAYGSHEGKLAGVGAGLAASAARRLQRLRSAGLRMADFVGRRASFQAARPLHAEAFVVLATLLLGSAAVGAAPALPHHHGVALPDAPPPVATTYATPPSTASPRVDAPPRQAAPETAVVALPDGERQPEHADPTVGSAYRFT
ncbi:MAG: sigma-70 family RNA polymerase sigma factor, partial [Actinomycetota bacterium]|nr:sigma-70 family RNA polymerase sigma factor [Actinomycetota bacterium]